MRPLVLLVVLFCAAPAAGQPNAPQAIVIAPAPIFIQPGAQVPLRVAKTGTTLKVLQQEGEWVEVEFNDPQFGRRVGWVERKLLRIPRPELEPMDLSVREEPPARVDPGTEVPRRVPRDTPAARAAASSRSKGWLDVNLGFAGSAQRSLDTQVQIPDGGGEFNRFDVGYSSPTGASFDLGAGVMFTPVLGLGVQFTGTAHRDRADLSIRIPHPLYLDAHATDSRKTDEDLDRLEGGANLSLVAALPSRHPNVSVRLYGGPTYFRFEADAVRNIRYFQQFGIFTTANTVEIREWETERVEETGWGFHAGVDFGYFFSRHFGIGGFARASRGTVTVSPENFDDVDVTVGGFQGGAGLRIRF